MSRQRNDNPTRPRHHRFALEPRQLFDGAAVAEAASHADNPLDTPHHDNAPDASKAVFVPPAPVPAPASITAPAPVEATPAHEVYVVDSHVQNWQSLVSQLPEGSRVVVLDAQHSGLEQINDALKNDKNISAIHIISHGASDEITLGSDTLNDQTIAQYQQQLETLGAKLTTDGDILLYGCNVTAKDTLLITRMADYTHADVAASSDETGNAQLAADWTLESHTGVIETRALALTYDGVLEATEISASIKEMVVAEPSTLRPGAETGQFSGLTITSTDDQVTLEVLLSDPSVGNLVSSSESGNRATFYGTVADAQAWLNALKFTASDIELGHQSATTNVNFFVYSSTGIDFVQTHITVTPSNDPVVVNDQTLIVPEKNGSGTVITEATLAALDPELAIGAQSATQIVYSLTAMPQYGYLTLNGTRLGVGSVFTQQDVRNGALKYIHTATGATQNAADSFSAKVNDGATPIGQSDTVTITLEIAPENQPPTISGSGIVYEGQPQNAVNTGNVGQYIVADSGGDTQDSNLTLTITALPNHGTLYFDNVEVYVGQQIAYADRGRLTYANDGIDGTTQDSFGVSVTDQGGGTATPASATTTINLDVQAVDDDPFLDANSSLHADVVSGPADVTLTPEMLTSLDHDSTADRVSFVVDTAGLTHGYLTLNGLRLQTGDTFTMQDVIEGNVVYAQYLNAQPGGIDVFNFRVIDHSTALRWNLDGSTFTRQGGIWDGNSPDDPLTHFQFTIGLVRLANNPTPDQVDPWTVPDASESSDYIGTDVTNPTLPPHGSINEGGSLVLSGTDNISNSTPGMSYVVQGVAPEQIIYTYLGGDAGQSGITMMKLNDSGAWVAVNAFGSFSQAELDAGKVRIVHDGGENFEFNAHFSVSAGQVTLDSRGNPVAVTWNPVLRIFVTPVNDAPTINGSSNTVLAEGETVYITTAQLNLRDPDDADSGASWESINTINGSNNYALNNELIGDNALKIVFQSLPTGGVLQYLNGTTWVTITSADIGTLQLDASLLQNDNSSGLRFVSNGSEVRNTSFIVSGVDRWGASSAVNATVGLTITNVNDGPVIPVTPESPDIVVPPDSPNNIGGTPANNPATVVEGSFVQINSAQLQAYDPDSSPEQVQYTLSSVPTHGRLAYSTDGVNFSVLGNGSTFTQADINSGYIYYLNNGDETSGNGQNADGFNFTLSDGDKEQANNHFAINITPANDKPTVTAPSGPIDIGGSNHAVNGFTVADPDIASGSSATNILQTTVRLLNSDGSVFGAGDYAGITLDALRTAGAEITGGNGSYLVITGTVAQINAALAGLTVVFPNDRNASYQVQVITDDRLRDSNGNLDGTANGGPVNQPATPAFGTAPGSVDNVNYDWYQAGVPANNGNISASQVVINASENNDPGRLVVDDINKNSYEDQPTIIGGDFTISDDESGAFGKSVTVTLTVAQGQLGVGGAGTNNEINGVTISGDNTGQLILSGTASAIQALLNDPTNGLTYLSAPNANHDQNGDAAGDVTLNIHLDTSASTVGDTNGNTPADVNVAITIIPVNDKPTVTAPSDIILLDNNTAGGNSVGGIVIGDPDAADAGGIAEGETEKIQVIIRITDDKGVPFAIAQYHDQINSAVTISSGNTTSGVTVQSVNPYGGPALNGQNSPLAITGTVEQINAYLAQLQVRISGTQLDDADQYFRVEVIVDDRVRDPNGLINDANTANGGDNAGPNGVGVSAVPLTEIDPYEKVPDDLEQNVTTAYRTVFQSSVNDPARVELGGNTVLNSNENSATVTLPPITITDVDAGSQSMTATVKLPAGFVFVAPTGSGGSVTGVGTDTLTFSGTYSQINSYLAALQVTLPDAPGSASAADWNGNFGVTVTVNDGGNSGSRPVNLPNLTNPQSDPGEVSYADGSSSALITTRIFTFTVNPVNDAPVVVDPGGNTGSPVVTLPPLQEDSLSGNIAGKTVNELFGGFFNDDLDTINNSGNGGAGGTTADSFYGIAITNNTLNASQGVWQYSLNGTNWLEVGSRSDSSALVLQANAQLRFVPAANYFGEPNTLGVRLVETNNNGDISSSPMVPLNGIITNIDTTGGHGGTSIYSETVITLRTMVTNINDRPTLGDTTLTLDEDTTGAQTIGQLFNPVYSDATDNQSGIAGGGNASGALGYIAIYGNDTDPSKGRWEYSLNGSDWSAIPADVSNTNAFVLASSAQIRFVPLADYNGAVTGGLQVRASDTSNTAQALIVGQRVNFTDAAPAGNLTSHWSDSATLTVAITPVVDAINDTFTTHANVPLTNNASELLLNDSFSNGDKTVTSVTQPSNGTLTLVNGVLTYTPNTGFVGTDSYTYTATSGGVTETATVTINVTNRAPIVENENQTIQEDHSAVGNVLDNDHDPDGAPDIITLKSFTVEGNTYAAGTRVTLAGYHGTLQVNANGSYEYIPDPDWHGDIQVSYVVTDSNMGGDSNGTLSLHVAAVTDAFLNIEIEHTGTVITTDVLANDTFSDANRKVTGYSQGRYGTVTMGADNKLVYTPTTGYVGEDRYTYTVTSGGVTETATVFILLTNTPPTATSQIASTPEDKALDGNVLHDMVDPDGDPLHVTDYQVDGVAGTLQAGESVVIAGKGSFILRIDGSYSFVPVADWHGAVPTITFNVSDNTFDPPTQSSLNITVTPVVDIVNDSISTHAGTPVTIDALHNDRFTNGDATITSTDQPRHGTVTIVNNQLVYTPNAGYVGDDTFNYTVTSGGVTETAMVTVTMTNTLPNVPNISITTEEDRPVLNTLLGEASDLDNDNLAITQFTINGIDYPAGLTTVEIPGMGKITITREGLYLFTPVADWHGNLPPITYTVSDGNLGGEVTSTLVIKVTPVVDIQADQASTHSDIPLDIDVLDNDSFSNPDQKVTVPATSEQGGTLVVLADNTVRYTPPQGYAGRDSFSYTVTSGGVTETTIVSIVVTNTAPFSGNMQLPMNEDGVALSGKLDVTDTDGDALRATTFQIGGTRVSIPDDGEPVSATIAGVGVFTLTSDLQYTFTPFADWNGIVPQISYTVTDDNGAEIVGRIDITVNAVKDAFDDNVTMHAGQSSTHNVFDNDSFKNPDHIVTGFTDPKYGNLTVNENGTVTYTPAASFVGNDSYTYTVTSGGLTETATVYITVNNAIPQAQPDVQQQAEDTTISGNVLTNDTDADNSPAVQDTLRVTSFNLLGETLPRVPGIPVNIPGQGQFILNADGSYVFEPIADWHGSLPVITYHISDGHSGGLSSSTLTLTVTPVADIDRDEATTHAGTEVVIDVLANDDFENSDHQITATTNGLHGTTTIVDGKIVYTPVAGFVGNDIFAYTVTSGGVRETTIVTIAINNTLPQTTNDTSSTPEDTLAQGNVLTNDVDADNDKLTVTGFTIDGSTIFAPGGTLNIPNRGTLIMQSDGSWTFEPVADWHGDTVPVVTYFISDGNDGGINSGELRIVITAVQDAINDTASVHGNSSITTDVFANDTFANSDKVIQSVTQGRNGTVTIEGNGLITYKPYVGTVGTDTYTYTVLSGGVLETAVVTVTIDDTLPNTQPDINITPEDNVVTGNVLLNDSDPDGDPLFVTQFIVAGQTAPAGYPVIIANVGEFTLRRDGSYTLTPIADWNGRVPTIIYTVSDTLSGGNANSTLHIIVSPVADITADTATTHAGRPVTTDIMANDIFNNPDATITSISQGANGSTVLQNGQIIYTPRSGYVGTDTYTYTVTSGGVSETTTVTVHVTNTAPQVNPEGVITQQGTPVSGNLLTNDSDPDGDPIYLSRFQIDGNSYSAGETVVLAGIGSLTVFADGRYSFTPQGNWHGFVPAVTYTVSDSNDGGESNGRLRILVTPAVEIQVRESGLTPLDPGAQEVNGTLDVLSLDKLRTLTFHGRVITAEQLQRLNPLSPITIETVTGTITLLAYYSPADGEAHIDYRFTLRGAVSQPGFTSTFNDYAVQVNDVTIGQLRITVFNDHPAATNDSAEILQDQGQQTTSGNLFNDDRIGADGAADNGPVTGVTSQNTGNVGNIGGASNGQYGVLFLDSQGNWRYQVNSSDPRVAALEANATLSEVFVYTITDSDGDTSEARLTILIHGVTAMPNVSDRDGDQMFKRSGTQALEPWRQSYEPGLFILPLVYSLQSDAVDPQARLNSQFAAYGYGIEHANSPVMEQAVLFSRWYQNSREQRSLPGLESNGLGQNSLGNAFGPFAMGQLEQRQPFAQTVVAQEAPQVEPPAIVALGAQPLSAQLAALEKHNLVSGKHITVPTIARR